MQENKVHIRQATYEVCNLKQVAKGEVPLQFSP